MTTIANTAMEENCSDVQRIFDECFKSDYKKLCLYAFRFLKDESLAEDVVQDCFVKLWIRRKKVDFKAPLITLLYTMVRNASIDLLRKRLPPASLDSTGLSIVNEVIWSETLTQIFQLAEQLPGKCREVFRLLFREGMDHGEVAAQLGITESTIRTQKAKALQFIKNRLKSALVIGMWFLLRG